MTRWWACLGVCCALWAAVTADDAVAQGSGREGITSNASAERAVDRSGAASGFRQAAESASRQRQPSEPVAEGLEQGVYQDSDRPEQKGGHQKDKTPPGGRGEGHRPGGGPRSGGPHAGPPGHLERIFIYDAVRRAGGPLEILPLLFLPQVRSDLAALDKDFDAERIKSKLDAYMAEMQIRIDENRKQAAEQPKSRHWELFAENLRKENERFQKFLDELPSSQQERLIYLFVQARNYRSLSNQLVVAKMGLSPEDAAEIKEEIEEIRQQTMEETRDRFRRIFDKGGGPSEFEKMVRENQQKMDARIEKKLTDEQRAKFAELRSKTSPEAPDWLVRGIDFPPPPPPRPRPTDAAPSKPLDK